MPETPQEPRRKLSALTTLAVVLAAFLLAAAAYVCWQAAHILFPQNVYETALPITISDTIEADGVLLFDETCISGSGNLGYLVADGERVSAGTAVAELYTDANQAVLRQQLTQLTSQIDLLQRSQNTAATQLDGLLKERLAAKGYTFQSETDTEVLVKLIDSCYTGDPLRALQQALAKVRGSYALAVLFRDYPDTIFAVKRESPLIVGWGEGENFVASDIPALLKYTRKYSVLEEGDMAVCTTEGIRFYNEFGEPVERQQLTADWDMEAAEKGGYPHFMLKEINEQPAAIMATVSPRVEEGLPVLRIPELTDEVLRGIGRVHLVGCGTAMHAGMVGKSAIETLARVPAEVDIASEFRYRDPILEKNDLVIIISQSGETSDTLAALKLAKSRGVPVLAIVNVVGSSIARAADYVMYTYAGPEIAVASTKAYMVQMCVLYLFALRLAYARGRLNEAETRRYTAQLLRAPEVIKPRLADCEQIKYLASRYVNTQSCFFIGRGFDYALSLEGSLKLKEISYVHSDAYAAGELKHGTISLITDGVPVIALATQKQVYEKTISNAKETRSRGARVLLFTTKDAVVPEGVADAVIRLDEYEDILMPLQLIVPLQLFAYYMAVLRGCDVDKPRNLAKSVTVE